MKPVRTYRMSVFSTWYDVAAEGLVSYEMHYRVARRGRIRTVREYLRGRGLKHFQQTVYRLTDKWLPKRKVKAYFEREEPAQTSQRDINIEIVRMERKGKRWTASKLPPKILRFFKRRRKR